MCALRPVAATHPATVLPSQADRRARDPNRRERPRLCKNSEKRPGDENFSHSGLETKAN